MRQGRRRGAAPRPIFAFAAAALFAMPAAVRAEEPLYLRIRPNPSPEGAASAGQAGGRPAGTGTGRETVWERADRRARIAIASVCTGCLDPRFLGPPPVAAFEAAPVPASRPSPATEIAASEPAPSTTGDP